MPDLRFKLILDAFADQEWAWGDLGLIDDPGRNGHSAVAFDMAFVKDIGGGAKIATGAAGLEKARHGKGTPKYYMPFSLCQMTRCDEKCSL